MKSLLIALVMVGLLFVISNILFVDECTYEEAMMSKDAVKRTCECRGLEYFYHNSLPVDGVSKSVCIGQIEKRMCFENQDQEWVSYLCD